MRLATLAAGLFLSFTGLVAAQTFDTPEALLEAFYEPYLSGEFPDDDSAFRSVYLQGLYDSDAESTPAGEMGALGFDPYIDGQDFEITELEVGEPDIVEDTATVEVSFQNFSEPRSFTYELVNEGGWKIEDVVSNSPDNPYRLSEIFAEAARE